MVTIFNKYYVRLLAAFLAVVVFLTLTPFTYAQSSEQINSFDSRYTIKESGVVTVEESINYYFNAPRHGIFRKVLYEKKNNRGQKFLLDIKDISVTLNGSSNVPYSVTKSGGYYQIKIGDPNLTITGEQEYNIKYDVYGALSYFDTHDEFYWNVTGNEWEVPIMKSTASVVFEPFIEAKNLNVICYTGVKGSSNQYCEYVITNTPSVTTQSILSLGPSEGLTIAVSFPKDKVAQLEPKRDWLGSLLTILFWIAGIGWYLLLPIWAFSMYLKESFNVKNKQKIVAAWFSPPKKASGQFYSPAETAYIHFKKIDNKFLTATLIDLAQRGFIKIRVESKKEITFIKTDKEASLANLTPFENDLIQGLFQKSSDVETKLKSLKKSTKFAKQVSNFKDHLSKSLKPEGLFKYDPVTYSTVIVTLGLIAMFVTGNILLGLVLLAFLRTAVPRTDIGIEKYSEAASLKNFLVSQDTQLDFQAENQMFFEKLLPYASAFGVEDVWIKRFGNLDIKVPDWYEGDIGNFYALGVINHSIASAIGSSVSYASSSSSSGFSSGFSGGSSGGGGGGGGGGSW
jgi:uncharacterized membrane protein